MMVRKPNPEKAINTVERNEAALERAIQVKRRRSGGRTPTDDPDVLYERRREDRDDDDRIAAAEEALAFSRAAAEKARVELAEWAAGAKHAALVREADAAQKRVHAIFDLQHKLASELAWLDAHVEKVADYNQSERGSRPFVADAEELVRRQPEKHTPARFEDIEVWVDRAGREASQFVTRGGKQVPAGWEHYRKVKRRVCTQTERSVPAQMPERLTTAVKLAKKEGGRLWPR